MRVSFLALVCLRVLTPCVAFKHIIQVSNACLNAAKVPVNAGGDLQLLGNNLSGKHLISSKHCTITTSGLSNSGPWNQCLRQDNMTLSHLKEESVAPSVTCSHDFALPSQYICFAKGQGSKLRHCRTANYACFRITERTKAHKYCGDRR